MKTCTEKEAKNYFDLGLFTKYCVNDVCAESISLCFFTKDNDEFSLIDTRRKDTKIFKSFDQAIKVARRVGFKSAQLVGA